MKTVILAGGRGTRIGEESRIRPKPMVEIGSKPIIWHILKIYSYYGFNDFIVCCGYKGQVIKRFFMDYHLNQSDMLFSLEKGGMRPLLERAEAWEITLADTGLDTLTAGRVLKIRDYLGDDEEFMLTYGDGVSDVDIPKLIDFHHKNGRVATITAVQPPGRFGGLKLEEGSGIVKGFQEKSRSDSAWVNAGFMVLNKRIFDYLGDGTEMLEASPFERLAQDGEMVAYRHEGFWSPMDMLKDKEYLEGLWNRGEAPWKLWSE